MSRPQTIARPVPAEMRAAEMLTSLMDDAFRVPVLGIRFGLDPLLGLVPWAGDMLSAAVSLLVITAVARHGAPPWLIARMCINVLLDLLLGSVPLAGDMLDVLFRANRRNMRLAQAYFGAAKGY